MIRLALLAVVLLACVGIAVSSESNIPARSELANFGEFLMSHQIPAGITELKNKLRPLLKRITEKANHNIKLSTSDVKDSLELSQGFQKIPTLNFQTISSLLNKIANAKNTREIGRFLYEINYWSDKAGL